MGKKANLRTLNRNLTKKVFSGSTQTARSGVKYYFSQTKFFFKEFLFRPIRNAGIASNVMLNVKEMLN